MTDRCANDVLESLEIDPQMVEVCVNGSFAVKGDWDSYNYLLGDDREYQIGIGVQMNPSLAINGHQYHGDLNADKIFRSICQAYPIKAEPEVCGANFDI